MLNFNLMLLNIQAETSSVNTRECRYSHIAEHGLHPYHRQNDGWKGMRGD